MVLLRTVQASGHLIPGQRNPFPGKGTQISEKCQMRQFLGQYVSVIFETCQALSSRIRDLKFIGYLVPFPHKRILWARDQMPRILKWSKQCLEALSRNLKPPFPGKQDVNNMYMISKSHYMDITHILAWYHLYIDSSQNKEMKAPCLNNKVNKLYNILIMKV